MKSLLFGHDDSYVGLIARLSLGIVMFPHGAQKMLGWFGGYGFFGTMEFFTETMGLPWIIALLVILIEFAGSIALMVGIGSRLASAGIALVMVGAISTVHWSYGFFMNWSGQLEAGQEGFEYHLLVIGLMLILLMTGSGRWSVDSLILSSADSEK